jgi:hypothetical protein
MIPFYVAVEIDLENDIGGDLQIIKGLSRFVSRSRASGGKGKRSVAPGH